MSRAAARKRAEPAARPSALEAFAARVEARATLWQVNELTLHEAANELQAAAERDGLVAELGQDEVQRLMAEALAAVRDDLTADISGKTNPQPAESFSPSSADHDDWSTPGWREAALEYHKDRGKRTLIVEIGPVRLARARRLLADDGISLERAWRETKAAAEGRAAESTVEAVVHGLREDGSNALQREGTRDRLAELSLQQLETVIARLARMRSKYSTVSERLLLALAELLP
jgi:hypothetical protein